MWSTVRDEHDCTMFSGTIFRLEIILTVADGSGKECWNLDYTYSRAVLQDSVLVLGRHVGISQCSSPRAAQCLAMRVFDAQRTTQSEISCSWIWRWRGRHKLSVHSLKWRQHKKNKGSISNRDIMEACKTQWPSARSTAEATNPQSFQLLNERPKTKTGQSWDHTIIFPPMIASWRKARQPGWIHHRRRTGYMQQKNLNSISTSLEGSPAWALVPLITPWRPKPKKLIGGLKRSRRSAGPLAMAAAVMATPAMPTTAAATTCGFRTIEGAALAQTYVIPRLITSGAPDKQKTDLSRRAPQLVLMPKSLYLFIVSR